MNIIKAKKITKKNFSKFGQLIDTSKKNPLNINDGYAKRFNDLINIDTSKKNGKVSGRCCLVECKYALSL